MEAENGTLFLRGNIGSMGTSRLTSPVTKNRVRGEPLVNKSATYMPAKTGSAFICIIEGRQ